MEPTTGGYKCPHCKKTVSSAAHLCITELGTKNLVLGQTQTSSVFEFVNTQKILYTWKPKEDITAYELALCLPVFSMAASSALDSCHHAYKFIEQLPECARRHFEKGG